MSGYPIQPYYDGLEVVNNDAPETLSSHGLSDNTYNHELGQKFSAVPESSYTYTKNSGAGSGAELSPNVTVATRPWYRRKRILGIIAAAILVLAIALGVGLGVGLSTRGGSADQRNDDGGVDVDDDEVCKGGFCGKILSINRHQDGLYIFGRAEDKKAIEYIRYNEESGDWGRWERLGSIGNVEELVSPPASQNWFVNGTTARLDVFVVESRDGSVWNAWHSDEEDWDNWTLIGDGIASPLATCALSLTGGNARLDVWGIVDNGTTIKTHWRQWDEFSEDDFDGTTEDVGRYDTYREESGWYLNDPLVSSTLPAIACQNDNDDDDEDQKIHEVMGYKDDGSLFYSNFQKDGKWSVATEILGNWIGEPTLLTADGSTEIYFFGVQEDHEMYWMKLSDLVPRSLGRTSITSVPAITSSDEGDQVDITALNSNGTIVHQHHDGVDWLEDWEDLGIQASSAPALRGVENTLFLFALSEQGELMMWELGVDASPEWKDIIKGEVNLEGKLSREYWTGD